MKRSIFLFLSSLMLLSTSSCGLIQSAARIPGSLLQTVSRTAGLSSLNDTKPQPETPTEIKSDKLSAE